MKIETEVKEKVNRDVICYHISLDIKSKE